MDEPQAGQKPVVIAIGGFLCGGGDLNGRVYSFWRIPSAALEAQGFRVVTVSPSPVGSLHDSRACEIFYELKGGTVCYGQEHSRAHGHACHGETYDVGLFSAWGEDNPVHVLGHSYGGQTARVLQHLLATGFFSKPGEYQTSAAWVRSVTTCNSPLNGSLLVYSLGEMADTAPEVRLTSHGHLLSVAIHALELLDWALLKRFFDPRLSHFELSWRRRGWRQGLKDVALAVVGKSAIYSQPDNAAFDMTVQSAHRLNQEIQTDPHTFYFSLVGTGPDEDQLLVTPTDTGQTKWVFRVWARLLSLGPGWKGLTTKLVYSALKRLHSWQVGAHASAIESRLGVAADSWSSAGDDGVLEGYTQSHPRIPEECEAPTSVGLPRCCSALKPGVWHTLPVHADHMWTNVDEAYTCQVFERLAVTLLGLVVVVVSRESDSASLPSLSQQRQQQRPGRRDAATPVRRSARLLAKARRARIDPQREGTTTIRSESADAQDDATCRGGSSVPVAAPGEAERREGSGVRCDFCATGSTATAAVGPDAVPFEKKAFHPRLWWVFLYVAVLGALLLSLLLFFFMPNGATDCKSGAGVADDVFVPRTCSSVSDSVGLAEGRASSGIDFGSPGLAGV
ncbi:unnamed protein product [Ectocarpus sp. 12 AP-2014]